MRSVAAGVGLVLLLTGCGAPSPADELRARVDDATVAANARDADRLREAAQALADTASAQRDSGRLPEERARQLIALAGALRSGADAVDPEVQRRLAEQARAREAAEEAAREAQERAAREAQEQAAREAAERVSQQQEDEGKGKGKGKGRGK